MSSNARVFVYVTKSNKFRARITEDRNIYEVTVGGESWAAGKGREYTRDIISGASKILAHLHVHYENLLSLSLEDHNDI